MSSSSVRVYVGGLPSDAKNQELRERFGRFASNGADCQLSDVVLPKPKPMGGFVPPSGTSRGFAYLTLEGADAATQSEKLQKTFNRTKWRGSMLKVQLAKPHFKLKLQQEWGEEENKRKEAENKHREQQELINAPAEELQPLKSAVKFEGRKKTRFPEVEEVEKVKVKEETDTEEEESEEIEQVKVQEEMDTEEEQQEQESEAGQETDTEVEEQEQESEADEETESETEEEAVAEEDVLGEDDVEAFVRQMEEEANEMKESEQDEKEKKMLTKEEMNARRLAALEAKQQRKKEEKVVIPAIGEAVGSKKITFDDSGNEKEPEDQEDGTGVISNWMDSSDDEAEGDDGERGGRKTFDFTEGDAEAQAAFALRPEFVGEKGKKLFEMQKRFGGDSRFRLDARFLEEEANEYGGNDVDEDEEREVDEDEEREVDEDAIAELQNFLEEENHEEAARHAREMREEEEVALRVVSKLFPDVDVTRLQRRMQEQRAPKDPLKEAAWMGELKRYDPRDSHARQEFEIPMTTASSGVQKEEAVAAAPKREKEIPTGGDRFFSTTGDLSNLFSRVRKNSEDGEEGEAALDGVFGFGTGATETGSDAPFKMSSLFSFPVGEDKPLAVMGEQLLEDEQEEPTPGAADWAFSQGFHPSDEQDDEAMATDSEAGDGAEDDEESKDELTKKRARKSLEDFLAFGRTFVGGDEVADWAERRRKLTLDYKRKRRDAVKMKKRQNKQQNKANKAKADASGIAPSSKWKKARL